MQDFLEGTSTEITSQYKKSVEEKLGILGLLGSIAFLGEAVYSLFYLNPREWASRESLSKVGSTQNKETDHFSPDGIFFSLSFLIWILPLYCSEQERRGLESSEGVNDPPFPTAMTQKFPMEQLVA